MDDRQLRKASLVSDGSPVAPVLAGVLGVSVTPVREALLELAAAALVEAVPNKGYRIVDPPQDDLDEILEVRLLRGELKESAEEHGELLDAISRDDAAAAAAIMTHHLQHTRGIWAGKPSRRR